MPDDEQLPGTSAEFSSPTKKKHGRIHDLIDPLQEEILREVHAEQRKSIHLQYLHFAGSPSPLLPF